MTKRDWAILGCRILAMYLFILGLFWLVQCLGVLGGTVSTWADLGDTPGRSARAAVLLALGPLIMLVSACLVWWQAPKLAHRLLADGTSQADSRMAAAPGGLDRQGAMEVAFVVLGVYLLAKGLSYLASGVYRTIWGVSQGLDWRRMLGGQLEAGTLVILGVCLVVGGRGLAAAVRGLRSAGVHVGAVGEGADEASSPALRRRVAILGLLIVAVLLVLAGLALGTWVAAHLHQVPF